MEILALILFLVAVIAISALVWTVDKLNKLTRAYSELADETVSNLKEIKKKLRERHLGQ